MRTQIKICGMTRAEDVVLAAALGADAVGLIFYPQSPRGVDIEKAQQIVKAAPAFLKVVGVFVNPAENFLQEVLNAVPLDLLQFHGEETPKQCASAGRPYIKTVHMREGVDLHEQCARYADARALLLDTACPDARGGTGKTFPWRRIDRDLVKPVILAGGLNADNVAEAIAVVRPYAVDVVSGVEAVKGVKDSLKMRRFITQVQAYKEPCGEL